MAKLDEFQNEADGKLHIIVDDGGGCFKFAAAVIGSCYSTIRKRGWSSKGDRETKKHYAEYIQDQAGMARGIVDNSPLVQMFCDISDNFEINKLRKKLYERANEIEAVGLVNINL